MDGPLLDASPEAAVAAGIAWLVTAVALALVGALLPTVPEPRLVSESRIEVSTG